MVVKYFGSYILHLDITALRADHQPLFDHGAASAENLILCFPERDAITNHLTVRKNRNNMTAFSNGKAFVTVDGTLLHALDNVRAGDSDLA